MKLKKKVRELVQNNMDLREKISTTDESVNSFISEMASMIDSAENSSAMQLADACLDEDFVDEEPLNA